MTTVPAFTLSDITQLKIQQVNLVDCRFYLFINLATKADTILKKSKTKIRNLNIVYSLEIVTFGLPLSGHYERNKAKNPPAIVLFCFAEKKITWRFKEIIQLPAKQQED